MSILLLNTDIALLERNHVVLLKLQEAVHSHRGNRVARHTNSVVGLVDSSESVP
jgi:hypothetical protein